MSSAPSVPAPLDLSLGLFADSLKWLIESVQDIPDARMAEQPQGNVNHPAWTLSHLNLTAGFLLQLLDETCPEFNPADGAKFGPGSKPVPDLSVHASKETLLRQLTQRHTQIDAAVRAKHATYFDRPTPENLRQFAPTVGKIAMYLLTAHENYHLGQLMQWRRAAGMAK